MKLQWQKMWWAAIVKRGHVCIKIITVNYIISLHYKFIPSHLIIVIILSVLLKNTISSLGSREKIIFLMFYGGSFPWIIFKCVRVFIFNIKRWEISVDLPFEFLFIQFICYYIQAMMKMEINLTKKKSWWNEKRWKPLRSTSFLWDQVQKTWRWRWVLLKDNEQQHDE